MNEEAKAKRRHTPTPDDVLRRMLNTSPDPHVKKPKKKAKKRSK